MRKLFTLDILHNPICPPKSPFFRRFVLRLFNDLRGVASSAQCESVNRLYKSAKKSSIFSGKASYARCLLFPVILGALEVQPWLGQPWESHFTTTYTYSRFTSVQDAHPQIRSPFNDQFVNFALGAAFTPAVAFDADLEFADTPRQSWGYRSFALQGRYMWYDDIVGDPVSLTTGISTRVVSAQSLKDVSCPYHSYANFELTGALGKEWDRETSWVVRTFGWGAIGMANRGVPWTRLLASIEGNHDNRHRFGVFGYGYFGFGHRNSVNPDNFQGYANIHHQSIDMGAQYTYVFDIWGTLSLTYVYRPFAHCFPKNAQFITLTYNLPFSFF